jgi:hypothetical protein
LSEAERDCDAFFVLRNNRLYVEGTGRLIGLKHHVPSYMMGINPAANQGAESKTESWKDDEAPSVATV